MISDDVIRDLIRQSMQGLELEPTMVLADALLETDRPDLGEDLALILSGRLPFPREQRGEPFVTLYGRSLSREGALKVIFRRIHRRFAWSQYDQEEGRRALRELREITSDWTMEYTAHERDANISAAVHTLEDDVITSDNIVRERATWLFNGHFGRGAQILAEEIADAPPSRHNREAQLFRLVLAFDDRLPPNAVNQVWDRLSPRAKRHVTEAIRQVLIENGSEHASTPPRKARSRRPR